MTDYVKALETILKGMIDDNGHQIDDGANLLLLLTPRSPLSKDEQKLASMLLRKIYVIFGTPEND